MQNAAKALAEAQANVEREKAEALAAQKVKEEAVRLLEQARLAAEQKQKEEEIRLKAAASAAEVVKKNELDHQAKQAN